MKIWYGFSSEHSSRMKIVGHFKSSDNAKQFLGDLEKMRSLVEANTEACFNTPEEFPRQILDSLFKGEVRHAQTLASHDLMDFANEMSIEDNDCNVTISSSEWNWAGVIKMMIESGARIEMFSEHDYPAGKDEA